MSHVVAEGYRTDNQRWEAVIRRDIKARNAFIYGVKTTGVCCRPNCSSRLPNRENVLFFDRFQAAEEAGFRPCKRCRPDRLSSDEPVDPRILRACRLLEEAAEPLTLRYLAGQVGLSGPYFQRLFKSVVGVTPKEYAASLRLHRVRERLTGGSSVTDAIYEAGFGSSSRFYENSESALGMTPLNFRKGGEGVEITYTVAQSSLGPVLVAATGRGICAIEFGASEEQLTGLLFERFPKAAIRKGQDDFVSGVERVLSLIDTPDQGLDLPLDIQGTAFQRRVWKALRRIPPGRTATYAEVAEMIGRPKAVRAVANACASNRIAIAVPCHRVVGSDGRTGGYRWGTDLKEAILKREEKKSS